MGKATLFVIAALSIMGAYHNLSVRQTLKEASGHVADHQFEVLARNAAVLGYNRAKQILASNFSSVSLNDNYENGSYTVTVSVSGALAKITSEGKIPTATGDVAVFKILAEVERESQVVVADVPPPFMQYALISEGNLSLNGNVLGDILVQGNTYTTLNASMHSNGDLHVEGNSVQVKGFGSFVGSGTSNPAKALLNSFQPNYNPTDAPSVSQSQAVAIPTFSSSDYTSKVSVDSTVTGDVLLSGMLDFGGTREDPYIWHVVGNLSVSDNAVLSGYTLFIVDGNITFKGHAEAGDTRYAGADESSMAFYAGGFVELGGNTKVHGQIFAGGDVIFMSGTPHVYGTVTTRGKADLRGTPKIYYRRASPALTTIWQEPTTSRLKLNTYSEW